MLKVAERFLDEGARVALATPESCKFAAPDGSTAVHVIPDRESSWGEVMQKLRDAQGGLDVLVVIAEDPPAKALAHTSLDEFRGATGTSIDMVFAANRAAVLSMREQSQPASGAIVNVTSFASHVGLRRGGMLNAIAGAIWNLSRQIGIETGEAGETIRVNSVHVGPDAKQAQALGIDSKAVVDRNEDVADAVIYLSSDDARLVTASDIIVDGGLSSGL